MKLRWYQKKSARKAKQSLAKGKHPVIAIPTGAGKSLILCRIADDYLTDNIENDVLILSHRSSILEQDFYHLINYFKGYKIGLYSAGLGMREIRKITVAGIQSVWRKPELFANTGLVIIDEAHLVNAKRAGMYRKFLEELNAQYLGLTATPFRLGHGYIYKGKEALFNHLAYDLTSTENYNLLVEQGYLSDMRSYSTDLKMKAEGMRIQAGDYVKKELSQKFDIDSITEKACEEIKAAMEEFGRSRVLVFAIDIGHANHIASKLNKLGLSARPVHSQSTNNEKSLEKFRKGELNAIVGIEMLTTGLDIPEIDTIALMRPTASPSLHVQMLGRGGRPVYREGLPLTTDAERKVAIAAGPKKFCLVLDFARNLANLGPINDVHVHEKYERRGKNGKPIMKVCPECNMENFGVVKNCAYCGHEFEFKPKLDYRPAVSDVIAKQPRKPPPVITDEGTWIDVDDVVYVPHKKAGKPPMMKAIYKSGMVKFYEYICIEHEGYARYLARKWVRKHFPDMAEKPDTLKSLLLNRHRMRKPKRIMVKRKAQFHTIVDHQFAP